VSVLPESAIRPGMRILGPSDGFPALPSCKIGLIRARGEENPLADALGFHIKQSLDNLGSTRPMIPLAANRGLFRGRAAQHQDVAESASATPAAASAVH
jgi:hypothetical protein